jgi:asparagine synthase (glutamine-hydrolysing)
MCGIAGVFRTKEGADDLPVVREMTEALRQRGPDGEGFLHEEGLTLGHRRLAIIDLSETGRQPMESASSRFVITFNGEIYNYKEIARELGVRKESLRSSSDTEILLLAWERWGPACLPKLVGQWAFAIFDRKEKTLHLVRDRFGEKPLFYHHRNGTITFSSTIASLLLAPWVSGEISPEALTEFLTLRYVVSPRTVLRDVSKVAPGHYLKISAEGLCTERWWAPRYRNREEGLPRRSRHELEQEFGERLAEASRRCMVSDVPVALLLSDGIDSNGIHAALESVGVACPTYTYWPTGPNGARTTQAFYEPTPRSNLIQASYDEMLESLEPALSTLTEPVGDGAVLATYHMIKKARAKTTVFLGGHGGDELIGGYRLSQDRFRLAAMHRFSRTSLGQMDKMVRTYMNGEDSIQQRRESLMSMPATRAPEAARYLIQRPLPPGDLAALFSPNAVPERYLDVIERLYSECAEEAADLDRIQEVALRTFLSEHMLTLADSTAMASSAESRLPFMDRDLADFVFSLPASMRVSRWPGFTNTKLIMRWWARGNVRNDVLTRGKSGFRAGNIRSLLEFKGDQIRSMIMDSAPLRQHLPGLEAWISRPPAVYRRGLEGTYWAILSFALWGNRAGLS